MLAHPLIRIELPVNPVLIIIGLMLAVLGNILPKVPRNFFVGIRTPWAISDEENWHKTHRVGGKVFLLGGFLMILSGVVPLSGAVMASLAWLIMAVVLFPLVYSFVLYLKRK